MDPITYVQPQVYRNHFEEILGFEVFNCSCYLSITIPVHLSLLLRVPIVTTTKGAAPVGANYTSKCRPPTTSLFENALVVTLYLFLCVFLPPTPFVSFDQIFMGFLICNFIILNFEPLRPDLNK